MKWMFISLGLLALIYLSSGLVYGEGQVIDRGELYEPGETTGYKEGVTVTCIPDTSSGYAEVELGHFYTLRDPTYEEAVAFFKAMGFSMSSKHIWLAKTLRRRVKKIESSKAKKDQ